MMSKTKTSPILFNGSAVGNPEVYFTEAFKVLMHKLCIHTPGIVEAYDRTSHIARIRPMIQIRYTDDTVEDPEPINVEVMRMSVGGFLIDMPIKAGDTGWFVSSDYDVTRIKKDKKLGLPSSSETHSFKRGFWIPDNWGSVQLGSDTDECMVIQSLDGSQRIKIGGSKIEINAENVTINSSVANINSPEVNISGDSTTINGDLNVTGTATISTDAVIAGISFNNHGHPTAALGSPSTPIAL